MTGAPRSRLAIWNFVLVFATTLYTTGGGMVESYVNYPSWRFVGRASWAAYRHSYEPLLPVFVLPFFLSFGFKVVLLFKRPAGVPRWGAWVLVVTHLMTMVATVAFIVPRFQTPLDEAPDPGLIDGLIFWDSVLRGPPGVVSIGVLLYLAASALRQAGDRA